MTEFKVPQDFRIDDFIKHIAEEKKGNGKLSPLAHWIIAIHVATRHFNSDIKPFKNTRVRTAQVLAGHEQTIYDQTISIEEIMDDLNNPQMSDLIKKLWETEKRQGKRFSMKELRSFGFNPKS